MSQPLLSILIPTLPLRWRLLGNLINSINGQWMALGLKSNDTEIITDANDLATIGEKRNQLLKLATGQYTVFIDDDDRISPNYLKLIYEGIRDGQPTHCSLTGEITFDGKNPKPFIHSSRYKEYSEDQAAYYRFPNHLNCIRADIAKQFKFPHWERSEDTNWATQLRDSGLLTNEYWIPETLYYYDYITDKKRHDYSTL